MQQHGGTAPDQAPAGHRSRNVLLAEAGVARAALAARCVDQNAIKATRHRRSRHREKGGGLAIRGVRDVALPATLSMAGTFLPAPRSNGDARATQI